MFPDPPHKKGLNTIIPKNKTFVKWNDMQKYQSYVDRLNIYLEKEEQKKINEIYKNDLDKLINYNKQKKQTRKTLRKSESLASMRFEDKMAKFENEKKKKEKNLLKLRIMENQKMEKKREEDFYKRKKIERDTLAKAMQENDILKRNKKKIMTERSLMNKKNINEYMKNYLEYKEKKKQELLLLEKKFVQSEKEQLNKFFDKNTKFFEEMKKNQRSNKSIEKLYKNIYEKKLEEQKIYEKNMIEKKYYRNLKKQKEKQERDKTQRESIIRENNQFLLNQIKNKDIKKNTEKQKSEQEEQIRQSQKLKHFNFIESQKKKKKEDLLKNNLEILKKQIEERGSKLQDDYLNEKEAEINYKSTVRINFEKPTTDIICGLPGFSRGIDRANQLKKLERNIIDPEKFRNYDKKYKCKTTRIRKKKSVKENFENLNFENEYEFIKFKNTVKPFNIISNQFCRR